MSVKTALITGAARGIGAAISKLISQHCKQIVIHYGSNPKPANELCQQLQAEGVNAISLQADISDEQQVIRLFDEAEKAFGGIDVLIQNAGVNSEGLIKVADLDIAEYDRLHAINNRGAFMVLREGARRVRDQGKIIALSTTLNRIHSPGFAGYATSKGIIDHLVPILAKELADKQISVNAVAPSAVDTALFREGKTAEQIEAIASAQPMQRLGTPEDIAPLVAFLASDQSGWISGQIIGANGALA